MELCLDANDTLRRTPKMIDEANYQELEELVALARKAARQAYQFVPNAYTHEAANRLAGVAALAARIAPTIKQRLSK